MVNVANGSKSETIVPELRTELIPALAAIALSYLALWQGMMTGEQFKEVVIYISLAYIGGRSFVKTILSYFLNQIKTKELKTNGNGP